MASSPQDYALWEAGRWSKKARRADDISLAQDMARIELDADKQRTIQRQEAESAARLKELQERDRLDRGAAVEADARRLENARQEISARTEAQNKQASYVDSLAKDREYEARDAAGRGLALDLVGQPNPVTGAPYTQAEALAKGAMTLRQSETAGPRNQLNLAEKYKAIFPRVGEAAMEAQDTEIGAAKTERYKQGLVRDQSLFESGKLGGAMPYANDLGAAGAQRELAVDQYVKEKPLLGLGAAGSAIVRGEEDRKTELEKQKNREMMMKLAGSAPGLLGMAAKYLGLGSGGSNEAAPAAPVQPKKRVFDFAPKTVTNSIMMPPQDELSKKYGPMLQR